MDNVPSVIQAKGLLGGSAEKSLPAKQEMGVQSLGRAGDGGPVPGSGRSEGNGNPLQCSCLGNPPTKESGGLQPMG